MNQDPEYFKEKENNPTIIHNIYNHLDYIMKQIEAIKGVERFLYEKTKESDEEMKKLEARIDLMEKVLEKLVKIQNDSERVSSETIHPSMVHKNEEEIPEKPRKKGRPRKLKEVYNPEKDPIKTGLEDGSYE